MRSSDEVADQEANVFAAMLLMPEPHFTRAMRDVDFNDDQQLAAVAKKFKVGIGAVCYRWFVVQPILQRPRPRG